MKKTLAGVPQLQDVLARTAPPPDASPHRRPRSEVPTHAMSRYSVPPSTGPPVLGHTTHEAARISGICRSLLYREIAAGRLIARKQGRRTLILDDDLRAFLESLPQMPATKPTGEAAAAVLDKTADAVREGEAS